MGFVENKHYRLEGKSLAEQADPPTKTHDRHLGNFWIPLISYVFLGFLPDLPAWIHNPVHSLQNGGLSDLSQSAWFLGYTSFALTHGHNLFFTNYLNFPYGINLVTNCSVIFLGLIMTPVTLLFSPVLSANIIYALAFSTSAFACFVLLRKIVSWTPAAYLGGLLYGFSPFEIAHGYGHLNWVIAAAPPIVMLLLWDIVIEQKHNPYLWGLGLGCVVTAQFFISTEMVSDMVLESLVGIVMIAVAYRRSFRERLANIARSLASAIIIFSVATAYPLWMLLRGPQHITGPAQPANFLGSIASDLAGFFIPTHNELINPSVATHSHYAASFMGGASTLSESSSYLGISLIVLLIITTVTLWKRPIVKFAAAMLVFSAIMSLGNRLTIDGYTTAVVLPFKLINSLPLLSSTIPGRFSLFVDLFAAILLAVGIHGLRESGLGRHTASTWRATMTALVVGVICLVPLIPNVPYASSEAKIPQFFTSAAVNTIPVGSVVLTYPFPRGEQSLPMLWQATNHFRYKLIGDYAITPGVNGTATFNGVSSTTEQLLNNCLAGQRNAALVPAVVTQAHADLRLWNIDTVIIPSDYAAGPGNTCAIKVMTSVLSKKPVSVQGAAVWWNVRQLLTSLKS